MSLGENSSAEPCISKEQSRGELLDLKATLKIPKVTRWASPHAWTCNPETGVGAKSWAIKASAPR